MQQDRTALERHYRDFHVRARLPRGLARRASAPLLMWPHGRWSSAKVKLLVVGQETLRWTCQLRAVEDTYSSIRSFQDFAKAGDGVDAMLDLYRWYALGRRNPTMNSPFWRGFRTLDLALNSEPDSALWTNIFKLNVEGSIVANCTRAEIARIHAAQSGLLRKELAVLKPDVVVFFTGPRYDNALREELGPVEFAPFEHLKQKAPPIRSLAILKSSSLPAKAVRSYHPEYLQRSRQLNVLEQLVEWLRPGGQPI